ncbi:hypothetical protein AVEN_115420-2 [Araneus ventricosus]|uniref:Uncharacterized protein n=1 Tax=Araneus ventricosus TaxID=182803 RepID=A0A4Y2UN78_ARAVE|nr:hypothetical protein AVEN_115420-2 [Araneus ventricosus]
MFAQTGRLTEKSNEIARNNRMHLITGMDAAQMARVLDALDDDISHLHNTVHDLEERTHRAISLQLKGYQDFRFFFLALNFALAPVLLAAALCYLLQQHFVADESVAHVTLHSLSMFLMFLAATLGMPMYLGALWAIYQFSVPHDEVMDELFR